MMNDTTTSAPGGQSENGPVSTSATTPTAMACRHSLGLVTLDELEASLSTRLIRRIRQAGLRTIGNSADGRALYRIGDVLDAVDSLPVGNGGCQRVPKPEERREPNVKGHKIEEVATNTNKGRIQPVSEHGQSRQMVGLVQDFRRTLDEKAV